MTTPALPEPNHAATPRLDTLVCRLAGGLALLAAAVFLGTLLAITRLPLVGTETGAGYAIPGTRHLIDAGVTPVLAWCGGVAALFGGAAIALGGFAGDGGRSVIVAAATPRARSLRRPVLLLAGGAVTLAAVLLLRR